MKIGRMISILVAIGLLLTLVPPVLASTPANQASLSPSTMNNGANGFYIAKHVLILQGRIYALYTGEVVKFTENSITIEPAKRVNASINLTFTVIPDKTKFPNGKSGVGDQVTIIAHKPYQSGEAALAIIVQRPKIAPLRLIRLEGTIQAKDGGNITLQLSRNITINSTSYKTGDSILIGYGKGTIFVIRNATALAVGQKAVILAKETDGGLFARGIFVGGAPKGVWGWLIKHKLPAWMH